MNEFWSSVIIKKSRKKYRCEYCERIIEIGSSYSRESGKFEGEMQDYALCLRCRKLLDSNNTVWSFDGEELGNFHDNFIESKAIDCPHCGSIYCESVSYTKDMMLATVVCDSCDEIYRVDLSAENLLSTPQKDGEG